MNHAASAVGIPLLKRALRAACSTKKTGPRLKKTTRDQCDFCYSANLIDTRETHEQIEMRRPDPRGWPLQSWRSAGKSQVSASWRLQHWTEDAGGQGEDR